ncbi:CoA transferase, partial [Chloroflexota bacterium]
TDLSTVEQNEVDSWDEEFQRFINDKTMEYLYEESIKRGIFLGPAYTIKDVAESKHLRSRDFWVELPHPELGENITYPGAFYQSNEAMPTPTSRAPLIGEHNSEIYCQKLGITEDQLAKLIEEGVV